MKKSDFIGYSKFIGLQFLIIPFVVWCVVFFISGSLDNFGVSWAEDERFTNILFGLLYIPSFAAGFKILGIK